MGAGIKYTGTYPFTKHNYQEYRHTHIYTHLGLGLQLFLQVLDLGLMEAHGLQKHIKRRFYLAP
jgi:hypothetical protein